MSVTCKDLLTLKHFQKIKLTAGERGLDRVITYPYVGQTTSVSEWVHGGELLFITGVAHNTEHLPQLLQECITKKLSGLVVLTGSEYIEELPQELLDMANNAGFPLFSMPWDLHLIDVTKEITRLIDYDQIESKKIHRLLNYLLFTADTEDKPTFDHEALVNLKISNYNLVAIFVSSKSLSLIGDAQETDLQHYLKELCNARNIPSHSMIYGNKVVLLISARTQKELEIYISYLEKVHESLSILCNDNKLLLAMGDIHKGPGQIRTSYKEAAATITILQKTGIKQICRYKNLGLYRLFLQMKPSEMQYYYHSQLDTLIDYDKKYKAECVETLKVFLDCFNNISKASRMLVIHRNTLLYRITKIEDVLGRSLSDPTVCIELHLALAIKNYLESLVETE